MMPSDAARLERWIYVVQRFCEHLEHMRSQAPSALQIPTTPMLRAVMIDGQHAPLDERLDRLEEHLGIDNAGK